MDNSPGYVSNPEMWASISKQMRSGVLGKPILAVDFDGTCAITHVVENLSDLDARPVRHVAQSLRTYSDYFDVYIVSGRAWCEAGAAAIRRALLDFGLLEEELDRICITNCKPPAHVNLGDRAWKFTGEWPTVVELLAFTPWHGRGIRE